MNSKVLWVVVMWAVATCLGPNAMADSFTFNVDYCGNPCLGGIQANNNGGTVAVSQISDGSNNTDFIVDVLVTLNNISFENGGKDTFAFNISGDPALTLTTGALTAGHIKITNAGGATWAYVHPTTNTDGAGSTFGYGFDCTSNSSGSICGNSTTNTPTSTLEFQIDFAGLTPTSVETTTGDPATTTTNVDFAADVSASGTPDCTGMIGAGSGTGNAAPQTTHGDGVTASGCAGGVTITNGTLPEPTSIALLGGILFFLFGTIRRKACN